MSRLPTHYEDILTLRKQEWSNFMWVSRRLNPTRSYKQPHIVSPQLHKDAVLKSSKIQDLLEELSKLKNVSKNVLVEQVKSILNEIGYNRKLKLIRWLGLVLVKICVRIYSGIYINRQIVVDLKNQMGNCPVIFVPSHRSYADFILMSLYCFNENLAIPAIAAGMDFHGMRGMGKMLRDTGAFFMRRTYNDDSLYWTTFKQYIYQIVTKGDLPIEFFIEGTRSRTNKSLCPKYGLILMILNAFFLSEVDDILFVPINISYDRILEEKLFAFELLGIPKPKESTTGFFKSLSLIKEKYGSIYVSMSEAISVKKFFGDLQRTVQNAKPFSYQEVTEEEKKLVPRLAHEIVCQQQKHCVITTFNLIALALNDRQRQLDINQLREEVMWTKGIIETLGGNIPDINILESLMVHQNLVRINDNGKLSLIWEKVSFHSSDIKVKGHQLSEATLTFCIPLIMLQIYINPVLHYFIDIWVLVLILKKSLMTEDALFENYQFLRTLLANEFVIFGDNMKPTFIQALDDSMKLHIIHKDQALCSLGDNVKCLRMLHKCFEGFLYSYYIICSVLLQNETATIEEKNIFIKVQSEMETEMMNGNDSIFPYSLNLDTISNCLNTLSSQRVLIKERNDGKCVYQIKKPELLTVKQRLEIYVPSHAIYTKMESNQLYLKNKL